MDRGRIEKWAREAATGHDSPYFRGRVAVRRHLAWHEDVMTEGEYAGAAAVAGVGLGVAVALVSRRGWLGLLVGLLAAPLAAEAVLHVQERAYLSGIRREAESLGTLSVAAARSLA